VLRAHFLETLVVMGAKTKCCNQQVALPSEVQNKYFFQAGVEHVENFEQQSGGLVASVCL
jgi:hypothetical protein